LAAYNSRTGNGLVKNSVLPSAAITFVNKANFLKVYNNFVLKWLILALCVVVVPEQILLGSIWRIL
jgi:hypothetical protein